MDRDAISRVCCPLKWQREEASMQIVLTKAIVYAAARDAYRKAHDAGASQAEAQRAQQAEFDRLFDLAGGIDGWWGLAQQ